MRLRVVIQLLIEQRIVLPGYTVLQELVGKALTEEQQRLIALMQTQLAPTERAAFDTLFVDTDGLYTLTRLKHEPKDFSLGEVRQEIHRADQLSPLYQLASRIVPQLEISNEGIKYYASLVNYYSVFRLQQLDPWLVYLYLLCFVTHRYQQCHDHLLTCFIHTVTQSIEEAKATVKEQLAAQRLERNTDMLKAGQILKLFTSDQIAATTPFQTVRSQAFAMLDRHKLDQIADYISTKVYVDEQALQWADLEGQAKRLKRHLRPILMAVDLTATRADAPLMAGCSS